jgi:ankyrin repeat protein
LAAAHNNKKLIEYFSKEPKYQKLVKEKTKNTNQTPLHYAAKYGCIDVVRCLINDFKVDKEVTDYFGRTPLYLAAEHGQEPTLKFLIKFKCKTDVISKSGQSALYWMVAKCPESVGGLLHLYLSFLFLFFSIFNLLGFLYRA